VHPPKAREIHVDPITSTRANRTVRGFGERRSDIMRSLANHTQRATTLARTGHRAVAWRNDRRLLPGDQFNGVAEVLLVVKPNIGHHRHAAIPGVHGVKATTQPDLNHRTINAGTAKPIKDNPCKELKLRHGANRALNLVSSIERAIYGSRKLKWGEWLPVDADSLSIRDQMRLWRAPMPHAPCGEGSRDEGADAPLPICPRNKCATHAALGVSERLKERNGALKPEADAEAATCADCNLRRRPRLWSTSLRDRAAHALACRLNLAT
jgi:hypothetical protein